MRWQKSQNGPDWTTIMEWLAEIEHVYSATASVSISKWGGVRPACLEVIVSAALPILEKNGSFVALAVSHEYPAVDGVSMEALILRLLMELEKRCEEAYQQAMLDLP